MTPTQLRKTITAYQERHQLPSFTRALEAFAAELNQPTMPVRAASVWAWLRGARGIREAVAARINAINKATEKS